MMTEVVMEANVGGSLNWVLFAQIILGIVVSLGGLYALFVIGRGIRRKEMDADTNRTIGLLTAENEALRGSNERLAADLHTAQQDIAKLDGRLVELTRQVDEYRQLIMGEQVPPALSKSMQDIAARSLVSLQQVFHAELETFAARMGQIERRGEERPFAGHERRDAVDE